MDQFRIPRRTGKQHLSDIPSEVPGQERGALIDMPTECRLLIVERPAHLRILRALAGKHEGHLTGFAGRPGRAGHQKRMCQSLSSLLDRFRYHPPPMRKGLAPALQREGHVVEINFGRRGKMFGQTLRNPVEGSVRTGRQDQQAPPFIIGRQAMCRCGSFLDDHMGIRPPEAERTHAGPARRRAAGPLRQRRLHIKRRRRKLDGGIGRRVVQARGNASMDECEHRLDQTGDTRRRIEMTDIGLHRRDGTKPRPGGGRTKGLGQGGHFDGISHRRAGPVSLDVGNRIRPNAGRHVSGLDHLRLALDAGCGITHLRSPIVIDGGPLDDGQDVIALIQRILQPLEKDEPHPAAADGAFRFCIEGAAVPVRGNDAAFLIEVADFLRHRHGHAARQRHIAFAAQQGLTGQVHGHKRCGASRLYSQARPAQIQFVGESGRQRVFFHPEHRRHLCGRLQQHPARKQVIEIAARARTGIHPDRPLVAGRIVAGMFQRLPCAFQQETLLRIRRLRFFRRHTEKGRIEEIDPLQQGARPYVIWTPGRLPVDARLGQFLRSQPRHRLHPGAEIAPERFKVWSTGKARSHAHDGDVQPIARLGLVEFQGRMAHSFLDAICLVRRCFIRRAPASRVSFN